ncbi:MAG: hypothetical protein L0Y80_12750 [Ignavibacteriae bacterium]|nr:hypothetical protein [Ignavibacteriota bacterium]
MSDTLEKFHRRSIRLKEYDYSQEGAYFITICTYERECVFGNIVEEKMNLSSIGKIADECWVKIPEHFPNVQLDEHVVMPNHIHGILCITDRVGVQYIEPLQRQNRYQHVIPKSLGSIIRSYKAAVTRISHRNKSLEFKWQRDYYEHIIRNEKELIRIRQYIADNVLRWFYDEENPINVKNRSRG